MMLRLRHNIYRSLKVIAPEGGLAEGTLERVNGVVGLVVATVLAGAEAVLIYACEKVEVPKEVGAIAAGERVFYNPTTKRVTTTPVEVAFHVGIATEPAGALAEYVEIDLNGHLAIDFGEIGS